MGKSYIFKLNGCGSIVTLCRITYQAISKEALAIWRIFSLVDMITKAKFSNSPNDFKIRLFG